MSTTQLSAECTPDGAAGVGADPGGNCAASERSGRHSRDRPFSRLDSLKPSASVVMSVDVGHGG